MSEEMTEEKTQSPQTAKAETAQSPEDAQIKSLTEYLTPSNLVILALAAVILFQLLPDSEPAAEAVPAAAVSTVMAKPAEAPQAMPAPAVSAPTPAPAAGMSDGIERNGEGRLFYTTIRIPANAETLYLSGSGASQKEDGTWGNMEEQAIDTFSKFKKTLESQGWSMSDIVQVRAFAVAGEYGLLDFDGFNRGYQRFFGTEENPSKPVRSFVQVADLVVDGWLVEIEIRAARVP